MSYIYIPSFAGVHIMALSYFVALIYMFSMLYAATAVTVEYINQNLTHIPESNTSVVTNLIIEFNDIPEIPGGAFISYPLLTYLQLLHNKIRYIKDYAFNHVNLRVLRLSHNDIVQLPISFNHSTYTLHYIGLNRAFNEAFDLATSYFSDFDRLRGLNLASRNPNRYFNATVLPKYLDKLSISDTFLNSFPDLPHYTLRRIALVNCSISHIRMADMEKLKKVIYLRLDRNSFASLPDISFMTNLKDLRLRGNNLNTLPDLYNCPLGSLRIWGNSLVCNYSLCWVRMWPFVKPALQEDGPFCAQPIEDYGRLLMDVDPVKMLCYKGRYEYATVS